MYLFILYIFPPFMILVVKLDSSVGWLAQWCLDCAFDVLFLWTALMCSLCLLCRVQPVVPMYWVSWPVSVTWSQITLYTHLETLQSSSLSTLHLGGPKWQDPTPPKLSDPLIPLPIKWPPICTTFVLPLSANSGIEFSFHGWHLPDHHLEWN